MGSYLLCCFDAYNVDAVVHEIDQFWVLQMMASIVEDIEAISVTVFIFIGPATANIKVGTVVDQVIECVYRAPLCFTLTISDQKNREW